MLQRLTGQLPEWARPDHPILRYELSRVQPLTPREKYTRALFVVVVGLILVVGGYMIATGFLRYPAGQDLTASVMAVVFWPVFATQLLLRAGVLLTTVNTVGEEKRRATWDNLRATESGAELRLRTRWAAVFYRMRLFIGLLIGVRVVLVIGILYDLTAFRGGYLDMLTANIVPELPVFIGAILLAFVMTASMLLPLTGIGLDAAIGLLLSTTVHERTYAVVAQILLILARVVIAGALLLAVSQFLSGQLQTADGVAWLMVTGFAAAGDWGFSLLQLGALGNIWALIPYALFIGLGLLIFALLQAAITDWLLGIAIRRAERTE